MTATAQTQNPFLNFRNWNTPHGTYPFNEIRPEHFMPAIEQGMKEGLADIDAIVNNPAEPTFENTITAYEDAGELLDKTLSCLFNLTNANTSDELDSIETEITPRLSEYNSCIRLNEGLFRRIKTLYDKRESLRLSGEQKKVLEDIYDSFAMGGANLSDADKQTYRTLTSRLSALTLEFGQNVLKATNAWTMLLKDESLLSGLNEDTRSLLRHNAEQKGYTEGWLLDLKPTTYIPVMQDLDNRDIRRELCTAYNSIGIGGEFDNTRIITEIVNTRLALARLFGKKNHAEKSLVKTMAKTPDNVMKLLDKLRDNYLPVARQEVADEQHYADSLGFYAKLMPWDWSYYSKKLKNERYSITDDELRPYFKLENVIDGVFGLARRLYGLTFRQNDDIQVYNPEVKAYEVFDEHGKFLAVYYADFHPRANKRGGAWMDNLKEQWMEGKTDSRPHVVNVMNFTRPTAEKPALLTYDEVRTFLHEFGHALHGMLTRCQCKSNSGTSVPRDFVELPSQFNENFIDEKEFLDTFARHYQTGEPMPQTLIDKMHASQTYHAAYACVRQLQFAYLDMAWHTLEQNFAPSDPDCLTDSVTQFGNRAMSGVQILPPIPGTQMQYGFTHIFSGGYAAGYYSYKWSEVLDADAFSVFKEAQTKRGSIFDRKAATAFRRYILERGSTQNVDELYRQFRGSDYSIEPLMKRDGISLKQ